MSGKFDYVERHELPELLRIRTASYSGFFAKHFPKDKSTPKQYFALTHAVEFLAENDFSGEGDEQPMETLHHKWNRLWLSRVTVFSGKWLWNIAWTPCMLRTM